MSTVLRTFFPNFIASFSRKNILVHLVAIVCTYVIVSSGFDWFYFTHAQKPLIQEVLYPAVIIGGFLPILLPIGLYIIGKKYRKKRVTITAAALVQAVVLGSFISSLYKAFTGRIQPDLFNIVVDNSHNFQFGFLKHGIYWGWPSSHTTIAFAMALTLVYLYPRDTRIKYGALLYALYIGLGISVNIHWFSEFVAGMCIGSVIGVVVGKSFSSLYKNI